MQSLLLGPAIRLTLHIPLCLFSKCEEAAGEGSGGVRGWGGEGSWQEGGVWGQAGDNKSNSLFPRRGAPQVQEDTVHFLTLIF